MEGILDGLDVDSIAEVQLFGYFPSLRLTTLFGSTFVKDGVPMNMLPLGPSILLLEDNLPDEKLFYIYMVVRERLDGGLRLSYAFPYEDWTGATALEVKEVDLKDEQGREHILEIEQEIPDYARLWFSEE